MIKAYNCKKKKFMIKYLFNLNFLQKLLLRGLYVDGPVDDLKSNNTLES